MNSAPSLHERWALYPVLLFAGTRLAVFGGSWLSLTLEPTLERTGGAPQLRPWPAFDGLCRWDCGWFLQLAERGYQSTTDTNFWPLFPLLVRGLAAVGVPYHWGILLVPSVASLVSFLAIYRVFLDVADERAARWGLAAFAFFPFAFFQAAGYPESLMICLGSLSVLAALRGRHLLAGALLGFGVLARHITILTGPALFAAQLKERGWRRLLQSPTLLGLLLPFAAAALYPLWLQQRFGDPLAFWAARDQWGPYAWWGPLEVLRSTVQAPQFIDYMLYATVPTLGALLLLTRRSWWVLAAFGVFMMAVVWKVGAAGLGRYSASCWPAYLPLGALLARYRALQLPALLALGLGQGLFLTLFVHQYPIL